MIKQFLATRFLISFLFLVLASPVNALYLPESEEEINSDFLGTQLPEILENAYTALSNVDVSLVTRPIKSAGRAIVLQVNSGAEAISNIRQVPQATQDKFRQLGAGIETYFSSLCGRAVRGVNRTLREQVSANGEVTGILRDAAQRLREEVGPNGQISGVLQDAARTLRGELQAGGQLDGVVNDVVDIARRQVAQGGAADQLVTEASQLLNRAVAPESELRQALGEVTEITTHTIQEVGGAVNEQLDNGLSILANNWLKAAAGTTACGVVGITAWYGSKVLWNEVERRLGQPELLIESSQKNVLQKIKNLIFGTPAIKLPRIIFTPKTQERLDNIVYATINIADKIKNGNKRVKYRNLLLWGDPGTGKTMFARQLARKSGMEFAIMTGASFEKFDTGRAIVEMDKLFAWAQNQNGVILFIDEADAFLSERKNIDPTSKNYQLLTNFLNHTGERSSNIMLVFATNHPSVLDHAMSTRIDDVVEVDLPGVAERSEILKSYRDSILLDERYNQLDFIQSVFRYLSDAKIEAIAKKLDGFSGRELHGIINTIKTDADITQDGFVSNELVDLVVDQFIEKHKNFEQSFGKK